MYCSVVLFSLVESFGGSLQTTSEDLGIGLSEDLKNVKKIQKSGKTQVNIFFLHFHFVFLKKKRAISLCQPIAELLYFPSRVVVPNMLPPTPLLMLDVQDSCTKC